MLIGLFILLIVIMLFLMITMKMGAQKLASWVALAAPIISTIVFVLYIPDVLKGDYHVEKLKWLSTFDIHLIFRLDGLSLLFGLLISFIGIAVFYYATRYLSYEKDNVPRFFTYLVLFMMSMLGIVLSNNTIVLYIFWELTSVSSFLLISYWYDQKDSQDGAVTSFMITVFGGLAMLVGFLMLYVVTGTNTITAQIAQVDKIVESPLFVPIVVMLLLGALTKSAQWPFHFWLPKAMAAPTPVSAYLHSATMVKAGIFLLLRYTPILGYSDTYTYVVTGIGLLTMLYGAITAIRQYDIKAILAYSTISQLGMIMTMVGIGGGIVKADNAAMVEMYAYILFAGMFHVVNHALFKGALFMGAGVIDHEAGTRDIRHLGGLKKYLPITMVVMTVASLSMAGFPFLNGFISKEMFFEGLLHSHELSAFNPIMMVIMVAIGWIASLFTFIYGLHIIKETFLGKAPKQFNIHEPKRFIAPSIIMALCLPLIFIVPQWIGHYIVQPAFNNVVASSALASSAPELERWSGINLPFLMSIAIIILGALGVFGINWMRFKASSENWAFHNILEKGFRHLESTSSYGLITLMNNRLNYYIITTLAIYFIIQVYGVISSGLPELFKIDVYEYHTFHIILLLIVIIIGTALIFIRQRLTMVILTSAIGYTVVLFFILMRAPDLALTQLVIETITTVLFIVSFSRLPNIPRGRFNLKTESIKILVSLVTALTVVSILFIIQQTNSLEAISVYYNDAYEKSGGKNIVNAILGDFRALDTLLESVVLIIAGLGIYTLLNYRDRRGQDERE
ncbi:DUF4040 family protein [Staphylococcus sp. 11262D007BW]